MENQMRYLRVLNFLPPFSIENVTQRNNYVLQGQQICLTTLTNILVRGFLIYLEILNSCISMVLVKNCNKLMSKSSISTDLYL